MAHYEPSNSRLGSPKQRSAALKRALELSPLQRGDLVIYKAHPEWGSGLVRYVGSTSLLTVTFEIPGQGVYEDDFHAQELRMANNVKAAAV